jgi:hypothetical protein
MYEGIWDEVAKGASLPALYVKEKQRRLEIERRYELLVKMVKQEGCDKVSQKIHDITNSKKSLH